KRKKSSKSEAKGTVTKVTGKKITKIIGLGKKKPSTDEQTSSAEEDVPTCELEEGSWDGMKSFMVDRSEILWDSNQDSSRLASAKTIFLLKLWPVQDIICFPLHSLFGSSTMLNSCTVRNMEAKVKDFFFVPRLNKAGKLSIVLILRLESAVIVVMVQRRKNTNHFPCNDIICLDTVSDIKHNKKSGVFKRQFVHEILRCCKGTVLSLEKKRSLFKLLSQISFQKKSGVKYLMFHFIAGYLNVLSNNRWRERWCRVKDNKLIFHKDRTDLKTHIVSIPLRGCEVIPGLDSKHPLTFRLLRNGQEVAVLEASSSEDMGRWIGILLAETGSSTDPGALHYDYIDVEMTASVIQAAKQTFCFMNRRVISTNPYRGSTANGYACPSGMALHYDDVPCINGSWEPEDGFPSSRSRNIGEEMLYDNAGLYDNLPSPKIFARYPPADRKPNRLSTDKLSSNHYKYPVSSNLSSAQSVTNTSAVGRGSGSQFKGKKPPATANGITGKGRTLNSQPKKSESVSCVKRTASNAEQYKYGKNRVEADAKRLQSKEEELLKRKEALRNRLAQLRKERKDLRAAIEVNAGRKTQVILEDKLKKLEEECKQKEAERVNLELELTEVKESLKKALAGGITLGLAIEPKSGTSSPQSPIFKHRTLENSPISSCDTSDTECSIPVNSAAALKRPPSTNNSPCRGHVLRKAKVRRLMSSF
ncbi:AFAP1 protein, partial [Burhinus bistriatus]|nr:AFAP1 protein [Burhinus bistriatus]